MMNLSQPQFLLAHLLATLGLGSTALGGSTGCGGSETGMDGGSQSGRGGASADGPNADDAGTDRADEAPPNGGIPPIVTGADATVVCAYPIVERTIISAGGASACPAERVQLAVCFAAPPDGKTCEQTYEEACIVKSVQCSLGFGCGPLPDDLGRCCYIVQNGLCPPGRPFMVDGRARLAELGDVSNWSGTHEPRVDRLDTATRAALADIWTQDALAEHASVASFARFVMQCLAVGAPADIVSGAQKACTEEIEHARIGFGLASAYAGRTIAPGPLDIRGALDGATDAVDIACSVASEGCIAETVSASLIAIARDAAKDPVVKTLLGRIADEEYEHALLAWRYLRWALERGDQALHQAVARVFERMEDHVALGPRTSIAASPDALRAHGYLGMEERRLLAARLLGEVIRPAAHQLLSAAPVATRPEKVA